MDGLKSTPTRRWLARLSFVLAGLAIVILLVFAGLNSLAMVAVGLAAAVVGLAAAYFFDLKRKAEGLGADVFPTPKPTRDWARLRYLAGISETAPRSPH
jgi:hypothetical protein